MRRREFLRLGLAGMLGVIGSRRRLQGAGLSPVPRVNGGIGVAPVRRFESNAGSTPPLIVPRLVELQMKAIYDLGFQQMRITISFERFGPNFLAAIPYVRAARALGIDVLGVLDQFEGFDLLQALARPDTREEVLETYLTIFDDDVPPASESIPRAGTFSIQVLNEPSHFYGIAPEFYVREFLMPTYYHLKEDDPGILVVSAAEVSSAEGILRARKMLETGMEHFCDRLAYHIYSKRWLDRLAGLTDKPVWITESGTVGTENHLDWITNTFDEIRRTIPGVERLFWYVLLDFDPDGFRLVSIDRDPLEQFRLVPQSLAVVDWLRASVRSASGDEPRAAYHDLIPDIVQYFPTDEDLRLIDGTSFAPRR
jgi:hypothetical protein